MVNASIALDPVRRTGVSTVVRAGALLGVVDGLCAIAISALVFHHPSVARAFESIASVILGKAALTDGASAVLLGLLMHFAVAFSWVIIYFLAYRAVPALRRWTTDPAGIAGVGAVLGVVIWFAMNFLVLRVMNVPHAPVTSTPFEVYLVQHILVVGPLIVATVR